MAPAAADPVCVNDECRNVPGVYGRATVSATGQVKVMGGVTGGPGVGPSGVDRLVVKGDNVSVYGLINGQGTGQIGVVNDGADEVIRFYFGPYGCRQIGDGVFLGACYNDPDQ